MSRNYVSWRRVSTFRQNRSGLGLAAQKDIINYFVKQEGGNIIADYEECYTGKDLSGCTELQKAIEHAKRENAVLVVAKTDRFRNTIEALKIYEEMGEGNIMFCDLPHTDKFTLTLFFALAEREALIVSIRTKQALKVARKRGVKVGASSDKYQEKFNQKTQQEKQEFYAMRGSLKKEHFQNSPDFKAFARILRNVFPDHTTEEDMAQWVWQGMNCKAWHLEKMLKMIYDYQAIDSTLFKKFNGTESDKKRLRAHFQAFRRSIIGK